MVRRWAYDLEFFVIARMKGYRRFIEAPVVMDYQFSSTTGYRAVVQVLRDTLNIWWRLKIRHTYERQQEVPLAEVRETK